MTDTTNPLLDTRALPRFAEITADHIAPALDEALTRHAATIEALVRDTPGCRSSGQRRNWARSGRRCRTCIR